MFRMLFCAVLLVYVLSFVFVVIGKLCVLRFV